MSRQGIKVTFISFAILLWIGEIVSAQGVILSAGGPVHRGMGGASTAAPISAVGANYWNPATISGLEHHANPRAQPPAGQVGDVFTIEGHDGQKPRKRRRISGELSPP